VFDLKAMSTLSPTVGSAPTPTSTPQFVYMRANVYFEMPWRLASWIR
jgi:hypothetical protein